MAISAKVGTFLIQASDVITTVIQVRGVGFQPKAIIFFAGGRSDATDAGGSANFDALIGFATSTTSRACIFCQRTDTQTNFCGSHLRTDACIGTSDHAAATSGIDGQADLNAMDADGFDIIIDNQFGHDIRVSYLALGGASITNAIVNTISLPVATTGNFDTTNAGFQPDFVFMSHFPGGAIDSTGASSMISLGAAVSSSARFTTAFSATGGTNESSYATDIEALSGFNFVETLTIRNDFVSFLSNGFRLNALEADPDNSYKGIYLALQGGNYAVGSLLTKTDTTDIVVTSLGFKPAGVFLASCFAAEDTQDVDTDHARMSMGAFTGPTEEVAHAIMDVTSTQATATAVEYDESYIRFDTADTVVGKMENKSVDSDGFTMVMTDTDPTAAFVGYIAFGPAEAGVMPGFKVILTQP